METWPNGVDSPFSSGKTATPVSLELPGSAPTPETCSPGRAPSGSSEGMEVLAVAISSGTHQIIGELLT
jgi:hypothetical protein